MLCTASQKGSVFPAPPSSELISWYLHTQARSVHFMNAWVHYAVSIFTLWSWMAPSALITTRRSLMCDLTISVSVAECAVVVFLFDFHIHFLVPALGCELNLLGTINLNFYFSVISDTEHLLYHKLTICKLQIII